MQPRWVVMHLASGSWPALVTRQVNGLLDLTVFMSGDIVYRMGVSEYLPDPDDTMEDQVGMWSNEDDPRWH